MPDIAKAARRWRWIFGGIIIFSAGFIIGGFVLTISLFTRLFFVPCPAVFEVADAADYAPLSGPSVFPARLLSHPTTLPPAGRIARVRGTVAILLRVEADGHVSQMHLVRSSGLCPFDIEGLKDVAKWRFAPANKLGTPLPTWLPVQIVFDPLTPSPQPRLPRSGIEAQVSRPLWALSHKLFNPLT